MIDSAAFLFSSLTYFNFQLSFRINYDLHIRYHIHDGSKPSQDISGSHPHFFLSKTTANTITF
ncbi:hypothetical protein LguiA_033869 [Lonicera macranthoides]